MSTYARKSISRFAVAGLWTPANHRGAETAGLEGEPQTGPPDYAGRQSAVSEAPQIRCDHRLRSQPPGISKCGRWNGTDHHQPTVGGGYHLHSAGKRVRISGRGVGRFLPPRSGVGAAPNAGGRVSDDGAAPSAGTTAAGPWLGASLRPRRAIRLPRLYGSAEAIRHYHQHESQGKSL